MHITHLRICHLCFICICHLSISSPNLDANSQPCIMYVQQPDPETAQMQGGQVAAIPTIRFTSGCTKHTDNFRHKATQDSYKAIIATPTHLALFCVPTSYPTGLSGSHMLLNMEHQPRSTHHWLEAPSPTPTAQASL